MLSHSTILPGTNNSPEINDIYTVDEKLTVVSNIRGKNRSRPSTFTQQEGLCWVAVMGRSFKTQEVKNRASTRIFASDTPDLDYLTFHRRKCQAELIVTN